MPKRRTTRSGRRDTGFRGLISACHQDLVKAFGNPSPGDNKNIEAEWIVKVDDKEIITIYNYKNSRCYSDDLPAIAHVTDWHIGGRNASAIDKIVGMMAGQARVIFRSE